MVLADIAKILTQIEVIGITGNSEVDTYLSNLKTYYIGVKADVTSTVSALQQSISFECADMTSSSVIHTSTSFTSVSTDETEISSESGLQTTSTTPDHLQLTTKEGHLLTTRDDQHILTTRGGHSVLTTKDGHHLLTTPEEHLLTTDQSRPLLTTGSPEKLTTARPSSATTYTTTTTATSDQPATLATSLITSGLCCRIKTVTSGSLQGRSAIMSIRSHANPKSTVMSM